MFGRLGVQCVFDSGWGYQEVAALSVEEDRYIQPPSSTQKTSVSSTLICPNLLYLQVPALVSGTSVFLVAQAKSLGAVLDTSFLPLMSHICQQSLFALP